MDRRPSTSIFIHTTLILCLFILSSQAFDRDFCEFGANDYTLEWAYEPNTEKVVFVLKMNATDPEFWTGVGFNGSRSSVDFVGVLVRNGQVAMADAYINQSGVLYTDVHGDIQTIGYEYNGRNLLVKFARALNSPDMVNDQSLDGCTTFLLPREAGKIEAQGIRPKLHEFHRFKVCDIKKHCSIDMAASVIEKGKITKKPKTQNPVKFAKSVDTSGTGDPCSFAGKDYLVNWTYSKPDDRIHFTMELPVKSKKYWSAVGIGEWMNSMDIAVLFLEDGKVKKIGDYLSTSYNAPDEDSHNDWKLENSKKSGNTATIKFSRAVKTDDKNDKTMEDCVLFQFGANLGKYGDEYSIQKHDDWPDLYKACDLREYCGELSFEKRAKNRKNKHKNEEEEEHAPETDENNDEKNEDSTGHPATTPKPEESEKTEQPTTASPSDEQKTTKEPAHDEEKVEATTVSEPQTTAHQESSTKAEDQPKTAKDSSEISEELASGEEPSATVATIKSTEISLDDSSGQEHEDESSEQTVPSKLVTAQPETTQSATDKSETSQQSQESHEATTTVKQDLSTESPSTTAKPQEITANATLPITSNAKADSQHCDPQKQDLAVCQSYMDNYLAQVKEWAARHEEKMEMQYVKACALLSAVPHVPTLCCNIYQKTCNAQVSN